MRSNILQFHKALVILVNRYFLPVVSLANTLKEGVREFGEQRIG